MYNVTLVELACDKMARTRADLAIYVSFAATDVDHAFDLGTASEPVQRLQHPSLPGAVCRQEKLMIHPPFTFDLRKVVLRYLIMVRSVDKSPHCSGSPFAAARVKQCSPIEAVGAAAAAHRLTSSSPTTQGIGRTL